MGIFPARILLATDGSKEAARATETALGLAQKTGSELRVVHVLYWSSEGALDPEGFDPAVREEVMGRARERLEELVGEIGASGGAVEDSSLRVGRPDAQIVAEAEEIGAGLIVMGSRGFGRVRRTFTGSVSDSVVRHAHCPVMVVRGEPVDFPARILLATDGSEEADLAASTCSDLAKTTGSELHVVCVQPASYVFEMADWEAAKADFADELERASERMAETTLEEQVRKIRQEGGEISGAHARVGFLDAEIVGLAGKLGAGLIVVGSRGRGPLRRALMGSVSDSVVRHAHCPVMVVRREEEQAA